MTVGKNGYSRNYKLQVHYIWKTAIWRLLLFNDKNNCSMKKLLFCDMKWKKYCLSKTKKKLFCRMKWTKCCSWKKRLFCQRSFVYVSNQWEQEMEPCQSKQSTKKRIRELVGFSLIVPFKHKRKFTISQFWYNYNCSIKHHFTIVYTIFPFIISFLNNFN